MTTLRPYKFLIIPVIQEIDDDGNVIQELNTEQPVPVFGLDGLHRFADNFPLDLAARTAAHAPGDPP